MKSIKKQIFILTQAALIVLLALSASLVLPARPVYAAMQTQYLIQLNTADVSSLTAVARTLKQKFAFASNAHFANVYSFSSTLSLSELQRRLAGTFSYLEIDRSIETEARVTTDDPAFTTDSHDVDRQWALPKAEFLKAWEKTKGSQKVIVAIIDTGIDATHDDLRGQNFVKGYNFETNASIKPYANSDDNGHGTLIAGIIGAVPDNGIGIAGGAWNVSLMAVKALDSSGSGSSSDIAEAIVWAADNGASVINMSLGGIGFVHDTTLSNAISYAFNKNVLLVAAAGNDVAINGGNINDNPVFPVCADNGENMIIGVTATDLDDLKPPFANFGKSCVDVSAPGRRIVSTINFDPVSHAAKPDAYAYGSGTSMAAPFVSAQAVLLKALFPTATNRQIRDRILSTADPIDDLNLTQCANQSCVGLLGSGRINVLASLQEEIKPYIQEGDIVELKSTGQLFYINGSKRHAIVPFVKTQRFATVVAKPVTSADLAKFPEGSFAEPLDGTLIKADNDPTVYYIDKGLKAPVSASMFKLRGFSFSNVYTLSAPEVHSWITASPLAPPEGLLVRTTSNRTVYWVVGGVLHAINNEFYINRGLNIFPVIYVSDDDMRSFSKGDPYLL